jgi:hypothetical protein
MTEDQLHALKCFIEAKIEEAICPSFANEQYLRIEEERLDRAMLASPSPQPVTKASHDVA